MNMECEVVCYKDYWLVLFACKRPRGSQENYFSTAHW